MRVLVMTYVFPNGREPLLAPYNRLQFSALGKICDVEVLSTVPWFPGARWFPSTLAGRKVEVPAEETIAALRVRHPRTLRLPGFGHGLAGALYAASLAALLRRERKRFDVLVSPWAHPDGTAAVMLGRAFGLPAAIKLHGSDINVQAKIPSIATNLRWALPRADRVLAVSRPLAEAAIELGARRTHTTVLMDGVESGLFYVRDRLEERRALGLPELGKIALFVGNLLKEKGAADLVDAFELLAPRRRDLSLLIIGEGPLKESLEERARAIGPQLRILGPHSHDQVARYLGAADLLTLPSWNEGTPSVLLEALSSGRPVVMTTVGGIPDIVDRPLFGELVAPRDLDALVGALDRVSAGSPDGAEIARESGLRDWSESAATLHGELEQAIAAFERDRGRAK